LCAKALMVDGELCSIGTMNMDIRSLKLHKELMVWIYDRDIARQAEDLWNADLADCRELTLDEIRSWSGGRRFRNSVARLSSQLL
jgi:cardiolipin synthase